MAHKTAIVITKIIIAIIVCSCTNSNTFKTPEIFDYDDYDYPIYIDYYGWNCYDCTENCYRVDFDFYEIEWEGKTTLKIDGVLYEDDPYYSNFLGTHRAIHVNLVPGNTYRFEVATPRSSTSVDFQMPYTITDLEFQDDFDFEKSHTLSWQSKGNNQILFVDRSIYFNCTWWCSEEHDFTDIEFYEYISPTRRNYTFPAIDVQKLGTIHDDSGIGYFVGSNHFIISNRFLFLTYNYVGIYKSLSGTYEIMETEKINEQISRDKILDMLELNYEKNKN